MRKKSDFKNRLGYLAFAIVFIAASNALMIDSNVGSMVWMASAVNVTNIIKIDYGTTLFVYAVIVTVANQFLLGKFDGHILLSNLVFAFPFSYLVGFFTKFYLLFHFENWGLFWQVILDVLGLLGASIGCSIYERVNLIQHPNDELAYIIRFKYLHGSAGWGQFFSYLPPILVLIVCFFMTGKIESVGLGTVLAVCFQGILIGKADHIIVPSLKHHPNESIKTLD
ncbi:hypothetical protein [Companilactobacillus kedongensis]|uniref:hypothetical protein n=1 Tax=Companilactobacillus kedongensis TaxID=2486004 RepID=UPI001CDD18E7|nr:hypothetical protein [Companilactobacillus kedongensis]